MDPITAIGLASAIISFVEIGTRIATRLEEMTEAGDAPKVFRDVRTRLPLILQIIEKTRDGTHDFTEDSKASFEAVVRNCYDQVKQLEDILKKVTATKNESRWKKGMKAAISLVEENRVHRIATALKDNVQLLTLLNISPAEKEKPQVDRRGSVAPPSYASAIGIFLVPFERDEHFIGREAELKAIHASFEQQRRVAVAGIGGVGKSQVAIEYCYRYKHENPDAHVFWVYGGNISRFYQGYKRIAQALELPLWDDPDTSILELVSHWFTEAQKPFLLVVDNADNIAHWWPGKYKSSSSLEDPSSNLANYLPGENRNGRVLITTRDSRVAGRLARQGKPISIQAMSKQDAKQLFLSKVEGEVEDYDDDEVDRLLHELDYLPLAISQAAAFIEENCILVSNYISALEGDDAEEFLHEELDDSRRDEESINSVFRTWKLSFDQITQQKPNAGDLMSLFAMLDRQSIPKFLFKDNDNFKGELTTSLGTLQSFNLITIRAGKDTYQLHRLVQRFVQLSLKRSGTLEHWRKVALSCVSKVYPTEIGVNEWDICDVLAPHVQIVTNLEYAERDAQLDLAHLLCWSADFDIERGMYPQALRRSKRSLDIFRNLVPETDERRVAATWLYGRLQYYEAKSEEDMNEAAKTLREALRTSEYPSMNYAESAFELAHLYYDQSNESASLEMGKASFECWKALEGPSSKRSLDNMHDYALELAMFGHEQEAIAKWNEILSLCPISNDASQNTKDVFGFRSLASIAEFQGDAPVAEIFYQKLISLCTAIYNDQHIHVFDYRLSHAEQVLRQDRPEEALLLSRDILESCRNNSEWQIRASCLQTMAECCRMQHDFEGEEVHRSACYTLHKKVLGHEHRDSIDVLEACARCYMSNSNVQKAESLWDEIIAWRNVRLGQTHADTVRAIECRGICAAAQKRDADAETAFLDALGRQSEAEPRLLDNLYAALWNQEKWEALEARCRETLRVFQPSENEDDEFRLTCRTSAYWYLVIALEQQGKMDEALTLRINELKLKVGMNDAQDARRKYRDPPLRSNENRRFGRMVHPRTWSA